MKMKLVLLTILSLASITALAMEPAKEENEVNKAYQFICSTNEMYEQYLQTSCELLEAILCKDKTRMSEAIKNLPKEGRAYLINAAHRDYHTISCDHDLQKKYPQLHAIVDKLPFDITPLAMAVRTGDQSVVELLHAYKVQMNSMSDCKYILEHAAERAPALIPFLITCGADVHANNEGALFAAARSNSLEAAKHLLAAGAKVNARLTHRDLAGLTPLHVAGNNGKYEVAKFFLKNGAEVDATDSDGLTPLHWCTMNANSHIALLLLESGADVTKKDHEGNSVIELISYKFQTSDAFELIKNGAPYPRSIEDKKFVQEGLNIALLFYSPSFKKFVPAIIAGDIQLALAAIKEASGNELNDAIHSSNGYTFLHWAVIRNNPAVVTELLNRRARHLLTVSQGSMFSTAAFALPLISRTIQHPVHIDAQDHRGRTPLMWAARLGLEPIYGALKQAGADENVEDNKGNNALKLSALGYTGLLIKRKLS